MPEWLRYKIYLQILKNYETNVFDRIYAVEAQDTSNELQPEMVPLGGWRDSKCSLFFAFLPHSYVIILLFCL